MKIQTTYINVSSQVVKTFALTLHNFSGSFNGTTADRFLQIHDAKALPADTAVPLRVYDLPQNSPFSWAFPQGLSLANGLVFAISTTEETLTISTDKMELFVDAESAVDDTGWSTAGDYTSAEDIQQVWADSAGPKRLTRLEFTSLTDAGADRQAIIRARDSSGATLQVMQLPQLTSKDFFFGGGYSPLEQDGATDYDGCTIAVGLYNSDTKVFSVDASPNYAIKASYKT